MPLEFEVWHTLDEIFCQGFLNKKTEIFDESTKPKITYEEDENSDDEASPSAKIEEVS